MILILGGFLVTLRKHLLLKPMIALLPLPVFLNSHSEASLYLFVTKVNTFRTNKRGPPSHAYERTEETWLPRTWKRPQIGPSLLIHGEPMRHDKDTGGIGEQKSCSPKALLLVS